jgi:hypothetical protein
MNGQSMLRLMMILSPARTLAAHKLELATHEDASYWEERSRREAHTDKYS